MAAFALYALLSVTGVVGTVLHALDIHQQFYPATIYLSTNKICVAVRDQILCLECSLSRCKGVWEFRLHADGVDGEFSAT